MSVKLSSLGKIPESQKAQMAVFMLETWLHHCQDMIDKVWMMHHISCMGQVCAEILTRPSIMEKAVEKSKSCDSWKGKGITVAANQVAHFDRVHEIMRGRYETREYQMRENNSVGRTIAVDDYHFFVFYRNSGDGPCEWMEDTIVECFVERQRDGLFVIKIERYHCHVLYKGVCQSTHIETSLEEAIADYRTCYQCNANEASGWMTEGRISAECLPPFLFSSVRRLASLTDRDDLIVDGKYHSGKRWTCTDDLMRWWYSSPEMFNETEIWPIPVASAYSQHQE